MSVYGHITELSLYPEIKRVFEEHGAKAIPEVKYKVTRPDFIVDWLGERWIVSIKIGDPTRPRTLKNAFMQYIAHMRDTGINYGMIIFYPEEVGRLKPSVEVVERVVRSVAAYIIVLNPQMEIREPLPKALVEIENVLRKRIPVSLSLATVVVMLRAQIEEIMERIGLLAHQVMRIISDPDLFFGINPVAKDSKKRMEVLRNVSTFLAAYIFLSQALFLRFYSEKRPMLLKGIDIDRLTRSEVRRLFDEVKNINYKPIFDIDVLDFIPERLIRETFKLLFALQIENIRYELPGRLFHELMPIEIRKLLAAFYTRPIAAYLLAQLTIDNADATVFDPACGSGTILTMAYRRKLELWNKDGRPGNPHKLFCERHIYGCDIMPFAVHLTNANLVAMDPLTTIDYTQVVLGDSLKLVPRTRIQPGFISLMKFIGGAEEEEVKANAFKRTGEVIEITLKPVDVILMNPPFTKIESGVRKYIDTSKFEKVVGREVGLWGHFVALADAFLRDGGIFGAVLPINLLRGRESKKVREIVFRRWLPLYIIKASKNYGFTEYAEYRDVLVIARKTQNRPSNHKVKFCIIKKDLNKLTEDEVRWIAEQIKRVDTLRSELLDIDSYPLSEVLSHFNNMMPFISGPSLEGKDALRRIIKEAGRLFRNFPRGYFREGYRFEGREAKFMVITNPAGPGRTDEAFLILDRVEEDKIIARTPVGLETFEFRRKHFIPSLRTPVGLRRISVEDSLDYLAIEPYEGLEKVMKLAGVKRELKESYWENVKNRIERIRTYAVVVRRVNPFSPNQMLTAFYSEEPMYPSDLFKVVVEADKRRAKAVVVLLNSIFFLAYYFNLKEETTGRYTDVRASDLYGMKLYPSSTKQIEHLVEIYEKYKHVEFPPLREQLDVHFETRYEWFWARERGQEIPNQPPPVQPHPLRLEFDMDVIKAVGANLTRDDLLKAYEAIVWDMIITRGLRRD